MYQLLKLRNCIVLFIAGNETNNINLESRPRPLDFGEVEPKSKHTIHLSRQSLERVTPSKDQ